jgi:hypothetical protein
MEPQKSSGRAFDRASENVGNIVALEHVNTAIPDQQLATTFYVTGLGLTRDPYLMTGTHNMWINVGRSQFHLPTGEPQVLRGRTGLVVPDLDALAERLSTVRRALDGTRFSYLEHDGRIEVVSPWGNRIICHAPDSRFGDITLGMPYVELDVPPGTVDGIASFYREIARTPVNVVDGATGRVAHVSVGIHQELLFRESDGPLPDYDGHHFQIYVADFGGFYERLCQHGLITSESSQHQYLFVDIVDPASGKPLYRVQHEVRSMRHPLYNRPLINRNPAQTNSSYVPGNDAWPWMMPPGGRGSVESER